MSIDFVPPVATVPATDAAPVGLVGADEADAILAAAQQATQQPASAAEGTAPADTPAPAVDPVSAPKTPREQLVEKIAKQDAIIAKATQTRAELQLKLDNIDQFQNLGVGSAVEVKLGRAETTRTIVGRVVAVDAEASRYKVFHGEGMDADIVVVQLAQILRVIPG